MRFSLLGPLVVTDSADGRIAVAGPRLRVLLAALLLHANIPVPADRLAEMVWDGSPPSAAVVTLRSYVKRLRRAVDPGAARIMARAPGYVIGVEPAELDILEFEALGQGTRVALQAGDYAEASAAAARALGLWRAAPLLDVSSEALRGQFVPRLERLRLQVIKDGVDAGLQLGHHQELIPQLLEVTAQHPLQERFHAQLMLALAGTGQRAQALYAFQQARRVIVDELGVEPGQELCDIHRKILAGGWAQETSKADGIQSGEALVATAKVALTGHVGVPARSTGSSSDQVIPRELPAPVAHFVGRPAELAELNALLDQSAGQAPGALVISAIGGTAGVGKTALALHWAHQVAGRFPDGQLYMNLRGYDPGQPMTAADALARFLRALGVSGRDIPSDEDERAAWYRTRLAGKRMLIVLDNARTTGQVRPLLPGTPSCAVVVTSRDVLGGLVARDGATRLDLDLLPLEKAVGLLRALIGERVNVDPGAAAALADQCSRLPLALRVAAELAVSRPATMLADLVSELADQKRRLDLLNVDADPRTAVRAVFSWSYRVLDADARRAFRVMGLNPGHDLDCYAAAALMDTPVERASRLLDKLTHAHLIQMAGPGRFGMHDLLRTFASDLAASEDAPEARLAALARLSDYYLQVSAAATCTLYPAENHNLSRVLPSTALAQLVGSAVAARAWLDAEQANLVTAAQYMTDFGQPDHAIQLATVLYRYLEASDHYGEAAAIHSCARDAARRTSNLTAEANSITNLGLIDLRQGRYQSATEHHRRALELFQEIRDRTGEARVLGNLGLIDFQEGRYQEASSNHRRSLSLYREIGDRTGEGRALTNLGIVEERQGRYPEAAEFHKLALNMFRESGYRSAEAYPLINLGDVYVRQCLYQQAIDHYNEALVLFHESDNQSGAAFALTQLGNVHLQLGRHQQAMDQHRQALVSFRKTGDLSGQAQALNGLGRASLATDRLRSARTQYTAALGLATQIGDKYQEARAHHGLAHVHHAEGDPTQSRRYWQQAHALYTGLGAPEAAQVRAELMTEGHRTRNITLQRPTREETPND